MSKINRIAAKINRMDPMSDKPRTISLQQDDFDLLKKADSSFLFRHFMGAIIIKGSDKITIGNLAIKTLGS